MNRLAAAIVAGAALLAACSTPATPPAPTSTSSSAAPKPLTWGDKATSVGVDVVLAKPAVAAGYASVPVTITNHAAGGAQVTYRGRVGGDTADWYGDPSTPDVPVQPGETVTTHAKFKLPAAPTGNLVIEVQINVGGAVNSDRPVFSGPLI